MTQLRLALLLALVPLLAGCMGPGGVPLPTDRLLLVRDQLVELDRLSLEEIDERLKTYQQEIASLSQTKDNSLRAELQRKRLLAGYCWERRGDFADAQRLYADAAAGEYGSVALFRTGQLAEWVAEDSRRREADPETSPERRLEASEIAEQQQKRAVQSLERAANYPVNTRVLERTPPPATLQPATWQVVEVRHAAYSRLDRYYRERLSYQVFDFLVRVAGGPDRDASYIIAIILIAVLAKLITTPLSAAQFRSMQKMQRLQPEIKKLQEKHKDDKQQLAKAQMDLFREQKINPFSSCLPMLIQMPILIWVYYGIRHFVFRFEDVPFLYISSLANPDVVPISGILFPGPLLLFYGLSMYFSQKLIAAPATTPEQEQQQKMMAYMMPLLFVFILKSLPAAFILYWLFQNILMTGHQYLIMRSQRALGGASPEPSRPSAGPPPEAIEKLSQGSRPQKTKKKRR